MSNLPAGAENDPRAPYNEPEVEYEALDLDISLTVTKTISVEVQKGSDNPTIAEAVKEAVSDELEGIGWAIEDIDW